MCGDKTVLIVACYWFPALEFALPKQSKAFDLMTLLRPKTLVTAAVLFLLAGGFVGSNLAQVGLPAPRVTLNASPASITPGSQVTFVAQLSSGYPNIRFRFVFGDGAASAWQSSSVITHTYQSPGKYQPFVDIGVASGGGVTRLGGSVRRTIQVSHAPAGPVDLFINPATAEIGRPVTLTVRTASNNPNIRYRFSFGDGSPVGGWRSSPQALHVYSKAGNYIASVDVAVMTSRGMEQQGSSRRGVTVSSPAALKVLRPNLERRSSEAGVTTAAKTRSSSSEAPVTTPSSSISAQTQKSSASKPATVSSVPAAVPSPSLSPQQGAADDSEAVASTTSGDDWRRYLWLLLPLALLGFIVGKWLFARPAVRSHADPGTATVVDAKGLVKNSHVVTPPSAAQGEQVVSSSSPLVKNVRRENG